MKEANYAETGRGQQALTGRDVERLYSIALCDDDERELDRIENFLASYQGRKQEVEYKTERFSSAEALLRKCVCLAWTCQLFFLPRQGNMP